MTKTAFVTIAGKTNAGKSTLLNIIIGERISSVSPKPQTTRTRITGILTDDDIQLVFTDTPGLHKGNTKLSEHMLKSVSDSVSDVDAVIFVIDCFSEISDRERLMLNALNDKKIPIILAVNKIDLLKDKSKTAPIIAAAADEFMPEAIIPISAKENDGINLLLNEVKKFAAESPLFFPSDMITDQPEKIIAAEMIREQLLNILNDEVPHGIAVEIESMRERDDKDILDISAVIYCEKNSHKGIIIGKNGSMLKSAGMKSRKRLEEFFCIKVNLKLWVKVKENWRNRENIIRSLGLSES